MSAKVMDSCGERGVKAKRRAMLNDGWKENKGTAGTGCAGVFVS